MQPKGFKPNLFHDPTKDYAKPERMEVRLHGSDPFPILEVVLHRMVEELGFKRTGTDIQPDHVIFTYQPK